ncbi:hypothetical protein BH18CHL2_BH18CHL2_10610 [soil metagenome]
MTDLLRLIRTLAWLSLFAALYQELKKPAQERAWHGRVLGVVPYDFRLPSWQRLRAAYWDPTTDRVFSDRVFGVGWALTIPVAVRKLNAGARQYLGASGRGPADPIALPGQTER